MKKIISIFFLLFAQIALAQSAQLRGTVKSSDGDKSGIPGASIMWTKTKTGTVTKPDGSFVIYWPDSFPALLEIRFTGYKSRQIEFKEKSPAEILVTLQPSGDTLNTIVITEKENASEFMWFSPINAEKITQRGLLKAACCNLSESFETNPSVDAAMTDAVSGAKKIQLLGLDGVYTQILFENLPLIRGLSSSYGLSHVPGTWIKSILITKGTGSVVNGYESIAGQLNIDILKPAEDQDPLFINGYANLFGRYEMNVHYNKNFKPTFGTTVLGHASTMRQRNDNNNDGFLDQPTYDQLNLMNRWYWEHKGKAEGQFGFRMIYDDRRGGQFNFDKTRDENTTNFYGIGILNKQAEVFNKTGFVFEKPGRSLGTMFSARYHEQDMFFGLRTYNGTQKSLYGNVIWQDMIGNTNHVIKTGLSIIYDDYKQRYNDSVYDRKEIVPGWFAEYTGHLHEKFTMVAGIRADNHNLAGLQITPRLHLKYDPFEKTAIRISGGRGFRYANVFTESSVMFASSRQVHINPDLDAEVAWNYGGSVQQKFKLFKREAIIVVDFFRTDFVNQILMDIETPGQLKIYNLRNKSYANSFQADLSIEPLERFFVRLAYKFYDVKALYNGEMKNRPLVARHRAFINLAYALPYDKWMFDFTTKWIGSVRIPEHIEVHEGHPAFWTAESYSKGFMLFNTHVTRKFRRFDIYAGVENIANLMQHNPIISAHDPFGPNFDAALVYAPMDGRTIYAGFRLKI